MKIDVKKIIRDIPRKSIIYILGAIGILLLVLPMFAGSGESETEPQKEEADYCALLEDKLEAILPQILGVGEVDVMITAKNSGEIRLAKDENGSERRTLVLNQKGGGEKTEVLEEFYPEIKGVLIVSDGGGNASVKAALTDAVSALLGVEAHRIKVFARK